MKSSELVRMAVAISDAGGDLEAAQYALANAPDGGLWPPKCRNPLNVTIEELAELRDSDDYRVFCETQLGQYTPERRTEVRSQREARRAEQRAARAAVNAAQERRRIDEAGVIEACHGVEEEARARCRVLAESSTPANLAHVEAEQRRILAEARDRAECFRRGMTTSAAATGAA